MLCFLLPLEELDSEDDFLFLSYFWLLSNSFFGSSFFVAQHAAYERQQIYSFSCGLMMKTSSFLGGSTYGLDGTIVIVFSFHSKMNLTMKTFSLIHPS